MNGRLKLQSLMWLLSNEGYRAQHQLRLRHSAVNYRQREWDPGSSVTPTPTKQWCGPHLHTSYPHSPYTHTPIITCHLHRDQIISSADSCQSNVDYVKSATCPLLGKYIRSLHNITLAMFINKLVSLRASTGKVLVYVNDGHVNKDIWSPQIIPHLHVYHCYENNMI